MVFNKIDAYRHLTIDHDDLITEKTKKHYTLEEWKQTWMHDVGAKTRYSFRLRKGKFRGIPRTRVRSCREIHVTRFLTTNFCIPITRMPLKKIQNSLRFANISK
jgi:GTP-binding protein HflX